MFTEEGIKRFIEEYDSGKRDCPLPDGEYTLRYMGVTAAITVEGGNVSGPRIVEGDTRYSFSLPVKYSWREWNTADPVKTKWIEWVNPSDAVLHRCIKEKDCC